MGLLEMKVEIAFCARENNDQPLDVGEPRNLVSDKPISGSWSKDPSWRIVHATIVVSISFRIIPG